MIKTTHWNQLNPIDFRKRTPLDSALANNHGGIVDLLVDAGANSGIVNTAFVAAEKGLLRLVRRLLNRDPKLLDTKNAQQQTLLMRAAANGHEQVIAYLLEKGACLVTSQQGKSALCLAWENRHAAVVTQLLLQAGNHALEALSNSDLASNKPFVKIAFAIEKLARKKLLNEEIHTRLVQCDADAVELAAAINNLVNLNELTLSRLHRSSDYTQRRIYLAIQQGIANYQGDDKFGRIRQKILSNKLESERHNLAEVYKIVDKFLRTGRYCSKSFGFFDNCKAYIFYLCTRQKFLMCIRSP